MIPTSGLPDLPGVPSLPGLPGLPGVSGLPSLYGLPSLSGLPDLTIPSALPAAPTVVPAHMPIAASPLASPDPSPVVQSLLEPYALTIPFPMQIGDASCVGTGAGTEGPGSETFTVDCVPHVDPGTAEQMLLDALKQFHQYHYDASMSFGRRSSGGIPLTPYTFGDKPIPQSVWDSARIGVVIKALHARERETRQVMTILQRPHKYTNVDFAILHCVCGPTYANALANERARLQERLLMSCVYV